MLISHEFGCHRSESREWRFDITQMRILYASEFYIWVTSLFLLIINVEKKDFTLKVLAEGMIIQVKTQILGTEPGSDFFCPWSVLFKETIDFSHYSEETHVWRWPKNLPQIQFSRILSKGRSTSFGLAHLQLCWK